MFNSLRNKFLASNLILVMFFIIVSATFFFTNESKHLLELKLNTSIDTSELYSNHISLFLDKHISILESLATIDHMTEGDNDENMALLMNLRDSPRYEFINTILISKFGTFIDPLGVTGDINDRDYFKILKENSPAYIISKPIIGRTTNEAIILLAVPILDENDQFVGAIAGGIKLETISEIIFSIKLEGESYGWIVDETGLVIAHPKTEIIMDYNIFNGDALGYPGLTAIGESMYKIDAGTGEYFDSVEGVSKIITYTTIPNTPGWRLAITTSKKEIDRPISDMFKDLILSTFIIMLLTIFVTIIYSHKLSQPLIQLTDAVKHSEKMDFTMLDYEVTDDEVGQLVSAYNRMTHSIKNHTENLEHLVLERTIELNEANNQLGEHNQQLNHLNQQLSELASTDQLTGLINRTKLYEEIDRLITENDYLVIKEFSLLFIDIDNFKVYNDSFGHGIGDFLLITFSEKVLKTLPADAIFSRYGGDEFIILLPNYSVEKASKFSRQLIDAVTSNDGYNALIQEQFSVDIIIPPSKYLSLSVGISHYTAGNDKNIDTLIRVADTKMYEMKKTNKS